MNCNEEAGRIKEILQANFPTNWDGKQCIMEMQAAQARNWRQMEWIGWYFEWKAFHLLTSQIGGGLGPTYQKVTFDYQNECVWDFKTHVNNGSKPWVILNDMEAMTTCIAERGSVGYIIANGPAFYNDVQKTFKAWHNTLIGDPSQFVLQGQVIQRPSRRRKTVFILQDFLLFQLDTAALARGQQEGWIKGFQTGMQNSNGRPRRGKIQIHLGKMPPSLLL